MISFWRFATICEAALRRGEVAMGVRIAAAAGDATREYGIRVNPPKSERFTPSHGDRAIVLA